MHGKKSAVTRQISKTTNIGPNNPNTASTPELLSAQRLPQKLNLTISILFKQRPSIRIKMATRQHMQLLWLASFPIRLERDVGRAKHVVVRHDH
jgi:hypothetical protein